MTFFDSVILGLVQGLTEFIPVSSSGHLIIVRELFGISIPEDLAFDTVLHLATALAVFIYFRKEIVKIVVSLFKHSEMDPGNRTYLGAILAGTIPAGLAGYFLEDLIESVLRDLGVVVISLVLGAVLFILAEEVNKRYAGFHKKITVSGGFVIGLFQALALIPGASRSGMSISGGFFAGLDRKEAVRFSFLLGFPVILGSGLKKLFDLYQSGISADLGVNLVVASIVALLSGFWAIGWLLRFLATNRLYAFVIYRLLLALAVFLVV